VNANARAVIANAPAGNPGAGPVRVACEAQGGMAGEGLWAKEDRGKLEPFEGRETP
jgi:hypothetical protein